MLLNSYLNMKFLFSWRRLFFNLSSVPVIPSLPTLELWLALVIAAEQTWLLQIVFMKPVSTGCKHNYSKFAYFVTLFHFLFERQIKSCNVCEIIGRNLISFENVSILWDMHIYFFFFFFFFFHLIGTNFLIWKNHQR